MAAIHDLIAQIGVARLRERLATEWAKATRERKPAQLDALFNGVM